MYFIPFHPVYNSSQYVLPSSRRPLVGDWWLRLERSLEEQQAFHTRLGGAGRGGAGDGRLEKEKVRTRADTTVELEVEGHSSVRDAGQRENGGPQERLLAVGRQAGEKRLAELTNLVQTFMHQTRVREFEPPYLRSIHRSERSGGRRFPSGNK